MGVINLSLNELAHFWLFFTRIPADPLQRFGFDPASASAPFVATLVDVTGLVIYFSIAALILSGTLL
ncbi:magnesium transporter [Xanthomonas citri pv. anacardii]|nr:magnesium transporter [Xanthomonas citri]